MRYLGEGHVAPWRKSCGSTPFLRAISRLGLPMRMSGALDQDATQASCGVGRSGN